MVKESTMVLGCIFIGCPSDAMVEERFCNHCYKTKVVPARERLEKRGFGYKIEGRTSDFKHNYGPQGGQRWAVLKNAR